MSSPGSGSSVTRVTSDKLCLIPQAPLTGHWAAPVSPPVPQKHPGRKQRDSSPHRDTGRPLMFSDD